jgi:type I restriction enzyme S subunit
VFEGELSTSRLGEIASFSKGKGISKMDIAENGVLECIRYGELYTTYGEVITEIKSTTNVEVQGLILSEANDVIIPASGETQIDIATASCVLKSGVALGGDLNIIKTPNNGVYLSYYLNNKKKLDIANLAQGISVVHLYSSQLASLSVNLPSLTEQNKVASFLSILDRRIQTQNKIIEGLIVAKKELTKRIFSQSLKFKCFDNSKWKKVRLSDMCKIIGGGTPNTNNPEYWNGGINWFTPTEIKTNFVSKSMRTISNLGLKNSSAKILPIGTILLTTRATIGEAAIAATECTTNQGFQSLIVRENYDNFFLFNWIKENKFELIKRANGSTFPEISKEEIGKIQITIPSIEEQHRIGNFLSSLDNKIELEAKLLSLYEIQKKYLLQNMFI